MRAFVVVCIFFLYAGGFVQAAWVKNEDALKDYRTALLIAFAAAYGYYIGSSKGSADKSAAIRDQMPAPPDAPPKPPPDEYTIPKPPETK